MKGKWCISLLVVLVLFLVIMNICGYIPVEDVESIRIGRIQVR